jgi:DNA polymerase-3 subunit gamma/tau
MSLSEYKVFARYYRPKQFKELVGQRYLVETLQNAIRTNKISHAFLLTGIRGVGKTTTARIMAMALNCVGKDGKENVAQIEPCLECANCNSIIKGNHPDILEMDAASKTGIDDVREIIINANYTPAMSRYKVFIIDEIHMLSNSAFNALLKTLEEPPTHTKFIFATTEIRKLPLTILSRCQKFDLKRVPNNELALHLQDICNKEGIKFTEEAINSICNLSGGSVRDSLSLLDQMRLVSDNNLTIEIVRQSLGYSNLDNSFNLFFHIVHGEIKEALQELDHIYNNGADIKNILNDLLEISYLVSKAIILKSEFKEIKVSSEIENKIREIAENMKINQIIPIWQMILKAVQEIKFTSNEMQALELAIIRICYLAPEANLEKIINNIDAELKKKI